MDIDVLLECTGKFNDAEGAQLHINAGAKKVILSAPTKGKKDMKTIVIGVNDDTITANDKIFSNASCTTNNAAPMLKILDDNWGIEKHLLQRFIHIPEIRIFMMVLIKIYAEPGLQQFLLFRQLPELQKLWVTFCHI